MILPRPVLEEVEAELGEIRGARTLGGGSLLIVGNVSGDTLSLPDDAELADQVSGGTLILGNYGDEPTPELRPWEVRILRTA